MSGKDTILHVIQWKSQVALNRLWANLRIRAPVLKRILTILLTAFIIGSVVFAMFFFGVLLYFIITY